MNQLLGTVFTGMITDENDDAYFVQKDGQTFRLKKGETTYKIGDAVECFGYVNQNNHLCATLEIPQIQQGKFGFGTVVDSRRDLGVFVDFGLPDKDVVVSVDVLPTMRELWPKKGDRLLISLEVDNKDRMWGVLAEETLFNAMSRPAKEEMKNKNITGTVYRLKMAGTLIITDDLYLGFVHPSERYNEPRLGEVVNGRVIGVRPDGILNISLKPRAHEVIGDDAGMILAMLERNPEHKLPYTDKSDPEEIKQHFGISKGQFKRALGNLMKQKKIRQADGFTYLLTSETDDEKK